MRAYDVVFVVCAAALPVQPLSASAISPGSGQVIGKVFCGDTGAPARFAAVQLVQAGTLDSPASTQPSINTKNLAQNVRDLLGSRSKPDGLSAFTSLDGSFAIDQVPPGIYFAVVEFAGYLSPLSRLTRTDGLQNDDEMIKAIQDMSEKVVVQPNQPVRAEIRIQRGSSISGNMRYEDGNPVPNVVPQLLILGKDGSWEQVILKSSRLLTDDRGRFHISGLVSGKYAIRGSLPIEGMTGLGGRVRGSTGDSLVVYSGGALHRKEVKPIKLGEGEDFDGADLVFPLDNLHTLAGTVVAKSDGHPMGGGGVVLVEAETEDYLRWANIQADGSFHLNYVPDGEYELHTHNAADMEQFNQTSASDSNRAGPARPIKTYAEADMNITVRADSLGLTLQVPDRKSSSNTPRNVVH